MNKHIDKYKSKFRREFDSLVQEKNMLKTQLSERRGVIDIEYYKSQIDFINEKIEFWSPIFIVDKESMKQINGYWVDANNNKWDCREYDENSATEYSKTLVECTNCINCTHCIKCNDCICCHNCVILIECSFCNSSINCKNCHSCIHCSDCDNCKSCIGKLDCEDYIQYPPYIEPDLEDIVTTNYKDD